LAEVSLKKLCDAMSNIICVHKSSLPTHLNVMTNISSKPLSATAMPIAISTVPELKSRLIRDKTGLTIIDIRAPETFNRQHLKGAISVPLERLEDLARSSLPRHREIYVYGESDEQSLQAAKILLSTGFLNVAQIIGGVAAWHELDGTTEGSGIWH
jgi:rhodanese-related sulfurtransferase